MAIMLSISISYKVSALKKMYLLFKHTAVDNH